MLYMLRIPIQTSNVSFVLQDRVNFEALSLRLILGMGARFRSAQVILMCQFTTFVMTARMHRDHKFEHLHTVYKAHRSTIEIKSGVLRHRLNTFQTSLGKLGEMMVEIRDKKKEAEGILASFANTVKAKIEVQARDKILVLMDKKNEVQAESELMKMTLDTLETHIQKAPQMDLIRNSEKIVDLLANHPAAIAPPENPLSTLLGPGVNSEEFLRIESEVVPSYESSVFRIHGFSRLKGSQEVVFSDVLFSSGVEWRLKVYCAGNGVAKGSFLSVFLEMVKGDTKSTAYQYRIELIPSIESSAPSLLPSRLSITTPRDPVTLPGPAIPDIDRSLFQNPPSSSLTFDSRPSHAQSPPPSVCREFTSNFVIGECWGYNRFCRLDSLTFQEGQTNYLDPADDAIVIRFSVRPTSYRQKCLDLERYIKSLKSSVDPLQESHHSPQRLKIPSVEKGSTKETKCAFLLAPTDSILTLTEVPTAVERSLRSESRPQSADLVPVISSNLQNTDAPVEVVSYAVDRIEGNSVRDQAVDGEEDEGSLNGSRDGEGLSPSTNTGNILPPVESLRDDTETRDSTSGDLNEEGRSGVRGLGDSAQNPGVHWSLEQLRSDMRNFESFVETMAREVRMLENVTQVHLHSRQNTMTSTDSFDTIASDGTPPFSLLNATSPSRSHTIRPFEDTASNITFRHDRLADYSSEGELPYSRSSTPASVGVFGRLAPAEFGFDSPPTGLRGSSHRGVPPTHFSSMSRSSTGSPTANDLLDRILAGGDTPPPSFSFRSRSPSPPPGISSRLPSYGAIRNRLATLPPPPDGYRLRSWASTTTSRDIHLPPIPSRIARQQETLHAATSSLSSSVHSSAFAHSSPRYNDRDQMDISDEGSASRRDEISWDRVFATASDPVLNMTLHTPLTLPLLNVPEPQVSSQTISRGESFPASPDPRSAVHRLGNEDSHRISDSDSEIDGVGSGRDRMANVARWVSDTTMNSIAEGYGQTQDPCALLTHFTSLRVGRTVVLPRTEDDDGPFGGVRGRFSATLTPQRAFGSSAPCARVQITRTSSRDRSIGSFPSDDEETISTWRRGRPRKQASSAATAVRMARAILDGESGSSRASPLSRASTPSSTGSGGRMRDVVVMGVPDLSPSVLFGGGEFERSRRRGEGDRDGASSAPLYRRGRGADDESLQGEINNRRPVSSAGQPGINIDSIGSEGRFRVRRGGAADTVSREMGDRNLTNMPVSRVRTLQPSGLDSQDPMPLSTDTVSREMGDRNLTNMPVSRVRTLQPSGLDSQDPMPLSTRSRMLNQDIEPLIDTIDGIHRALVGCGRALTSLESTLSNPSTPATGSPSASRF
ncbi:hypothetical protein HDU67_007429 [Dinochytrium kinnereticum]|nr:hypothetical protein HDU67_007429 [Dinochytrium kinnereticum]